MNKNKKYKASDNERLDIWIALLLFLGFSCLYFILAWLVSGPGNWWLIDNVDGQNIFFGDDAYRFFLTRSAWLDSDLYTYSFVLPGQLFLDGILTWLVNGDIYRARLGHALIGALSVGLTYLVARRLNISLMLAFLAAITLGMIPRFALMNLSFYGEMWLSFFLLLCFFLFINKRLLLLAFVAAWLPLIRPEGIFFLLPLAIYFAWYRRFWHLGWLILPGFVFFVYLNLSFDALKDYHFWRVELRRILAKIESPNSEWAYLSLYTYWLTVPALAAVLSRSVRRQLNVFLWGALLWLYWLLHQIPMKEVTIENRYIFILLPLTCILWASFFERFIQFCATRAFPTQFRRIAYLSAVLVACTIAGKNILKIDNFKLAVADNGYKWTIQHVLNAKWDKLFAYYPQETINGHKKLVERMYQITELDSGIDMLAINTPQLFLFLDPYELRSDIRVGFLTNSYIVFHLLLDGQSFIQHPGGRMFTYLTYGVPDWAPDERRALVATQMPTETYPYVWQQGMAEMYLFSYVPSHQSATEIEARPDATIERVDQLRRKWYGAN